MDILAQPKRAGLGGLGGEAYESRAEGEERCDQRGEKAFCHHGMDSTLLLQTGDLVDDARSIPERSKTDLELVHNRVRGTDPPL